MRNGKVPQIPMEKVILFRSLFRGREDVSPTDRFVEETCEPFHAWAQGRPSIPPGVYLRMMMGIAWRWSDSLALRDFLGLGLGLGLTECVPDHVVDGDPEALANRRSRGSLPVRAEGAA